MLSLLKNKNKDLIKDNQQGFTIVELVIVIAIASLILVIALAVVPTIRRSARDRARNADISALQAQITTYQSNNSGSLPTAATGSLTAALSTDITDEVELSHYDATTGIIEAVRGNITATTGGPDIDIVHFIRGAECKTPATILVTPASAGAAAVDYTAAADNATDAGSTNQFAILYVLEGEDDTVKCLDF